MRRPRFQPQEWLSEDQIKYLFGRHAAEKRGKLTSKQKKAKSASGENPVYLAEVQVAADEEDQNLFMAASEADTIEEIKEESESADDGNEHPITVISFFYIQINYIFKLISVQSNHGVEYLLWRSSCANSAVPT